MNDIYYDKFFNYNFYLILELKKKDLFYKSMGSKIVCDNSKTLR